MPGWRHPRSFALGSAFAGRALARRGRDRARMTLPRLSRHARHALCVPRSRSRSPSGRSRPAARRARGSDPCRNLHSSSPSSAAPSLRHHPDPLFADRGRDRLDRQLIAERAEAADHALRALGDIRVMAKRLAGENVRQMHFDTRDRAASSASSSPIELCVKAPALTISPAASVLASCTQSINSPSWLLCRNSILNPSALALRSHRPARPPASPSRRSPVPACRAG